MQFVTNGPDIPDALLQAHEEGRVVFFCGAGVSYPAGLPGFKGLVDQIYMHVGTTRDIVEQGAYDKKRYDATLGLLERRLPGQRLAVRDALAQILTPKLRKKGAKDTHKALLRLSTTRKGALRLVTTNFDRIFEHLTARVKPSISSFAAPFLPVPKDSRWNGLVYLHGLLPKNPDDDALNRLVLTSGDFGLAYLTERWAARFVSGLFRNYIVCFVGYSIDDPVLRYMMDAMAADRLLGESSPVAYAFGDCTTGQESRKSVEWEAKGVTPILYEVPTGTQNHSTLHFTLKAWADTYRDGILGKESIVVDYAITRPSASTQQDDFIGRMLWALSDPSGLPAKRFAEFNPVPSLEWLDRLTFEGYGHRDLVRFGVAHKDGLDENLSFSMLRRPTPYTLAPWMALVGSGAQGSQWDPVMLQFARWLVRHLDDPALILWLADCGGSLHDAMTGRIEDSLNTIYRLERDGDTAALLRMREHAPRSIPRPVLRPLWRLFLAGRIKSAQGLSGFYRWQKRFEHGGLTTMLRLEIRDMLAPKVSLKKPFRWPDDEHEEKSQDKLKNHIHWDVVLTTDHIDSALKGLSNNSRWQDALATLLSDFEQLLLDALDIMRELDGADDHSDRSHRDLPSISPHGQNRAYNDWVLLIKLTRDAWIAFRATDPTRATIVAVRWFDAPYPTFKRLALHAASFDGVIASNIWVDWLLTNNARWLWSVESMRETMRLLVLQGSHLSSKAQKTLEAVILEGPPQSMNHEDIEPGKWQHSDHSIWLHLAKLESSEINLGADAAARLEALSQANPQWQIADNQSDEFSHWMSGTGDPDFDDALQVDLAPRRRAELVEWLKNAPEPQPPFHDDTWGETCQTRFFHCALALSDLAKENIWPSHRWRIALQVWSGEKNASRSWRYIAPLVGRMPQDASSEVLHSLTRWLETMSKGIIAQEDILLKLCQRVLDLPGDDDEDDIEDPVDSAINHPVGIVTEALLNLWPRREPNDEDGLPVDLKPIFTLLCNTDVNRFRHGRVLLASRLITLFRVDRQWTEAHMLPLLDWGVDQDEAHAAWEGFLWSPRIYRPLLIAIKTQFLDTALHYDGLGGHARRYSAFLTHTALNRVETYSAEEFQAAFGALPREGLNEAAQALDRAIEGAGDQREEYWENRVAPFWRDMWPKTLDLASNNIAESLARLSIAARGQFPAALTAVSAWLRPLENPGAIVHWLHASDLSQQFPEEALRLLDVIIDDQPWAPQKLEECLSAIVQAEPALQEDQRYLRLLQYHRQHCT